jgi:hypothetical protein
VIWRFLFKDLWQAKSDAVHGARDSLARFEKNIHKRETGPLLGRFTGTPKDRSSFAFFFIEDSLYSGKS